MIIIKDKDASYYWITLELNSYHYSSEKAIVIHSKNNIICKEHRWYSRMYKEFETEIKSKET